MIELIDVAVASAHSRETAEVEGVTLRIEAGDFWVIGGLHGLGSSNLVATMAGLAPPLSGVVRLFGRETYGLTESELLDERRRIGMVFGEGGRMLKHLTVSENVALPLRYHYNLSMEESGPRVKQILDLTGLTAVAHNTSGMISLNWQQRAGLARTLALCPEVLLLDKPLVGLKASHCAWWLNFLFRLSEGIAEAEFEPMTLVATTDDFAPWTNRARQFARGKKGRWFTIGGREQLEAADWSGEAPGGQLPEI
jgi:ABC-type methionine transport system ATPase subunit